MKRYVCLSRENAKKLITLINTKPTKNKYVIKFVILRRVPKKFRNRDELPFFIISYFSYQSLVAGYNLTKINICIYSIIYLVFSLVTSVHFT